MAAASAGSRSSAVELYTIGSTGVAREIYVAELKQRGVKTLADVRGNPSAGRHRDLHRSKDLQKALAGASISYEYWGDKLGEEQVEQLEETELRRRLRGLMAGVRQPVCLLGHLADPLKCHRLRLCEVAEHACSSSVSVSHLLWEDHMCTTSRAHSEVLSEASRHTAFFEAQLNKASCERHGSGTIPSPKLPTVSWDKFHPGLLEDGHAYRLELPFNTEILWYPQWLKPDDADILQAKLKEVQLEYPTYSFMQASGINKEIHSKRGVARYCEEYLQRHQQISTTSDVEARNFDDWTKKLLGDVELACGSVFNCVWLNEYSSGRVGITWHTDLGHLGLGPNPVIGSVSVGATRSFLFKSKRPLETGEICQLNFPLKHGSLVVMGRNSQTHWLHSIPPEDAEGMRYNLTFRFYAREDELRTRSPEDLEQTSPEDPINSADLDTPQRVLNLDTYQETKASETVLVKNPDRRNRWSRPTHATPEAKPEPSEQSESTCAQSAARLTHATLQAKPEPSEHSEPIYPQSAARPTHATLEAKRESSEHSESTCAQSATRPTHATRQAKPEPSAARPTHTTPEAKPEPSEHSESTCAQSTANSTTLGATSCEAALAQRVVPPCDAGSITCTGGDTALEDMVPLVVRTGDDASQKSSASAVDDVERACSKATSEALFDEDDAEAGERSFRSAASSSDRSAITCQSEEIGSDRLRAESPLSASRDSFVDDDAGCADVDLLDATDDAEPLEQAEPVVIAQDCDVVTSTDRSHQLHHVASVEQSKLVESTSPRKALEDDDEYNSENHMESNSHMDQLKLPDDEALLVSSQECATDTDDISCTGEVVAASLSDHCEQACEKPRLLISEENVAPDDSNCEAITAASISANVHTEEEAYESEREIKDDALKSSVSSVERAQHSENVDDVRQTTQNVDADSKSDDSVLPDAHSLPDAKPAARLTVSPLQSWQPTLRRTWTAGGAPVILAGKAHSEPESAVVERGKSELAGNGTKSAERKSEGRGSSKARDQAATVAENSAQPVRVWRPRLFSETTASKRTAGEAARGAVGRNPTTKKQENSRRKAQA
eukprot:TRINITY_DN5593_c0_g1_i1.p1 TRINITY_DN5593_c0_g1~~TRINITY_DN5593_c0_g1_i1.p1  ORF type:complete len:1070 (+),score=138.03 TRINITY_DN5593_c0_g1_i1:149-3358(+)